jgi:hypothetical protein
VRFEVDDHPIGLVDVDITGKAVLSTVATAGTHTIEAIYTGNDDYQSSAASTSVTISKAATSIYHIPTPWVPGQIAIIPASLTAPMSGGFPTPSGTMTVREGSTVIGTIAATGGGLVTYTWPEPGTYDVTIEYPGDANYEPSSYTYGQIIAKPLPSIVIELTPPSNIIAGSPVTLRASSFASPQITGTIRFYVDNVLRATVPLSQGTAETQTTFDWGMHEVRASYGGDATWREQDVYRQVTINSGTWGSTPLIRATATYVQCSRITGAVSYTLWRKTSAASPWSSYGTCNDPTGLAFFSMPANTTWLFAVTAKDASNNVSPMSAPDLATSVVFNNSSFIRAQHIPELRTAVGAVRTFAGLTAFTYTNAIAAGNPIRTIDVQQLRVALNEARNAIGLPLVSFTDPVLTPGQTPLRSAHVLELRTGTD